MTLDYLERTIPQAAVFAAANAFEAACDAHGLQGRVEDFHASINTSPEHPTERRLRVYVRMKAHATLPMYAGHGFNVRLPGNGRAHYMPGEDRSELQAAADRLAQWFADHAMPEPAVLP